MISFAGLTWTGDSAGACWPNHLTLTCQARSLGSLLAGRSCPPRTIAQIPLTDYKVRRSHFSGAVSDAGWLTVSNWTEQAYSQSLYSWLYGALFRAVSRVHFRARHYLQQGPGSHSLTTSLISYLASSMREWMAVGFHEVPTPRHWDWEYREKGSWQLRQAILWHLYFALFFHSIVELGVRKCFDLTQIVCLFSAPDSGAYE